MPSRTRRRPLTAKRGFTAWAMVMYAFLYLPILVMVIFAFDKPSATSLASHPGRPLHAAAQLRRAARVCHGRRPAEPLAPVKCGHAQDGQYPAQWDPSWRIRW